MNNETFLNQIRDVNYHISKNIISLIELYDQSELRAERVNMLEEVTVLSSESIDFEIDIKEKVEDENYQVTEEDVEKLESFIKRSNKFPHQIVYENFKQLMDKSFDQSNEVIKGNVKITEEVIRSTLGYNIALLDSIKLILSSGKVQRILWI